MYRKPPKRKNLLRRALIYLIMAITVFVLVTLITLFMLGFRLSSGNLERYAFLQFNSKPTGASVSINGVYVSSKTPTKSSVPAGKHDIVIQKDGYKTWSKSIDIKSGTLTWLNYAILVPEKINVNTVASYDSVYSSSVSPKGDVMLIQKSPELAEFDLVDLNSENIKIKNISVPKSLYSDLGKIGIVHKFDIEKWDESSRYVLISHSYNDSNEWIFLDTQNVINTKNITQLFDVNITNVVISGSSGNTFYALDNGDIRKFNISDGTISKPLLNSIISFNISYDSKLINYVAVDENNIKTVGVYSVSDEKNHIIKTIESGASSVFILSSRYFNENYLAIAVDKKTEILIGEYPAAKNNNKPMKLVNSFDIDGIIENLSFSPTGEYVLVQSGNKFTSYDIEYRKLHHSIIDSNTQVPTIKWLDNSYVYYSRDNQLIIREFDGQNSHAINQVISGQAVAMTRNSKYIYSVNKVDSSYQLQRALMILP